MVDFPPTHPVRFRFQRSLTRPLFHLPLRSLMWGFPPPFGVWRESPEARRARESTTSSGTGALGSESLAAAPLRPAQRPRASRARSRTPPRPPLPPMRAGAPGRRGGRAQGALPRWLNEDDRWAALEAFERDILAASTVESAEAKLRTVRRAIASWRLEPFPPTTVALRALGATLKRGVPVRRVVPPPLQGGIAAAWL